MEEEEANKKNTTRSGGFLWPYKGILNKVLFQMANKIQLDLGFGLGCCFRSGKVINSDWTWTGSLNTVYEPNYYSRTLNHQILVPEENQQYQPTVRTRGKFLQSTKILIVHNLARG
ncbi:uncharacterized protein LOC124419246 [Lucilia cuprina]|uniref:uncharacterized protein LOC124419246 n=1 Tax=Lucilia cuprina TaxID=7375 RepID=UPI001F0577CB|nr:uncharacterized protein LOC124419246 [Lucilia cuprina]